MASVDFGAALSSIKDVPEFARRAESLGYDYLCSGEHMMFHGAVPNSLVTLAVAAGATSRIKLMSTVVLLPLYTPMVLAKMTSVLDVASEGRYHMGIGVGGEFPKEFEACGVPVKQRGSRSNEALAVIKKLWTEKNVGFEGRYSKFSGVTLDPQPTQRRSMVTAGFPTCTRPKCCTRASRRFINSAKRPGATSATSGLDYSSSPRSTPIGTRHANRQRGRWGKITPRTFRKSPAVMPYTGILTIAVSACRNTSMRARVPCW